MQSDWEAIPDVGDYSLKIKQKKKADQFTPLPDHMMHAAMPAALSSRVVSGMSTPNGFATPVRGATPSSLCPLLLLVLLLLVLQLLLLLLLLLVVVVFSCEAA